MTDTATRLAGDRTPAAPGTALTADLIVVVPTLNEARGIEACLASILDGLPPGVPVIVADGGSTDGTPALAAGLPGVTVVRNPRRRPAAAVNLAAGAADPDAAIIVRCDAHATYPPGFVSGVAAALRRRGAGTLAVPMDAVPYPDAGAFERANAAAVDTPLGSGGSAHRGGACRSGPVDHGHHAGLDRAWFDRLGGYDEGLIANEDAEYDTRLRAAGGLVWLEASLRIAYHPRRTPKGLWQQYHAYGRGRAAHVLRHKVRPRARQLAPALHVALLVASLLAAPLAPILLAYPGAYLAALAGFSVLMAVRRRAGWGLLCGACVAIMHLAWGTGFWRGALEEAL